jgi:hypothetical protein
MSAPDTDRNDAAGSRWNATSGRVCPADEASRRPEVAGHPVADRPTESLLHPSSSAGAKPRRNSQLLWWALAAFAVQLAVWSIWFVIAARHPVAEVPVVNSR